MSTQKEKIEKLLQSYNPENIMLAYLLLQSELGWSAAQAVRYIMEYAFEHYIGREDRDLHIRFSDHAHIHLYEYEDPNIVNWMDTLDLRYTIKQNGEVIDSGYLSSEYKWFDGKKWSGYATRNSSFEDVLERFLQKTIPIIVQALED